MASIIGDFVRGMLLHPLKVERIPVNSSNVRSIGYNGRRRHLVIEYHNGRIYVYKGVEKRILVRILESDSKGQAVWKYIRGWGIKYERLR